MKSLRPEILIILVLFAVAGCSTPRTETRGSATDWETFLKGPERTSSTPDIAGLPARRLWKKNVAPFELFKIYPREELASPVIFDSVLYSGSTNGRFYSLDFAKGERIWRFRAGYYIESVATAGPERVCFGSSDGILRCLDRKTGKEIWRYRALSEIISSPVISGERIFFYSSDDRVHALDLKSGKKIWTYSHRSFHTIYPRSQSSPALSPDGNLLYQYLSDGSLVCLAASDGAVRWEKKISEIPPAEGRYRRTPAALAEGVLAIGTGFKLLILDGRTGDRIKELSPLEVRDFSVTDKMLFLAGKNAVVAVNRKNGAVVWKMEIEKGEISSIFTAGGTVFALSNETKKRLGLWFLKKRSGYITAVDGESGTVLWQKGMKSTLTAVGSSSGGRFALLVDRGRIEVWGSR